jgi:hypothetical protein
VAASGQVARIAQTEPSVPGVKRPLGPDPQSFQKPTFRSRMKSIRASVICPNAHSRAVGASKRKTLRLTV